MKTIAIVTAFMLLLLSGCAAQTKSLGDAPPTPVRAGSAAPAAEENMPAADDNNEVKDKMRLLIGKREVPVTWEENASVEALRKLCPITIQMSMYGGFEQVGPLGRSIARADVRTNAGCGDIVLYLGNRLVIFYGPNSWEYTRLGHIDLSQQEMRKLLGNGDVAVTLKRKINY